MADLKNQDDLWPDDLLSEGELRTTLEILRRQASLLSEKTKHALECHVESVPASSCDIDPQDWRQANLALKEREFIVHRFVIVVPCLGNYRYGLLWVAHGVGLYPAAVGGSAYAEGPACVVNEEELTDALQSALASEWTRRVVSGLLAQSRLTA